MKINIKPLSVNQAWQGRRFKTKSYQKFEQDLLFILPSNKYRFSNNAKLRVIYRFGFSNALSDLANPEKLITDILVKKYGFDDRQIYEMQLFKEVVKKGLEFIDFEIYEIFY